MDHRGKQGPLHPPNELHVGRGRRQRETWRERTEHCLMGLFFTMVWVSSPKTVFCLF